MPSESIAIGCDHAGLDLKRALAEDLRARGLDVLDLGTEGPESVDYPDFAQAVARAVRDRKADRGVLICGTGIGMSMAANRFPEVRAAVVHDRTSARLARQHNDANVLCLGGRLLGIEVARDCLAAFLDTPFEGGRHERRVAKLSRSVTTRA
ncbi:MAG TPA: ribose 5-phosphate isomerase B [Alphaproteobacteria bacterium]